MVRVAAVMFLAASVATIGHAQTAPTAPQTTVSARAQADALQRARYAYNQKLFDQAIALARQARATPALADSAALVLGRAHLERFRTTGDVTDVSSAREAFSAIRPDMLIDGEKGELHLGTAELLFLDDQFGAAAELFEIALSRAEISTVTTRDRVFDWWASALDRHAQLAPEADRAATYRRILQRAEAEAAKTPSSAVAMYWLAAAARGADDPDRAWAMAIAGWVQAPLAGARATTLRSDLDRLMIDGIIPDRARRVAPPGDPKVLLGELRAEWDTIKQRWKD